MALRAERLLEFNMYEKPNHFKPRLDQGSQTESDQNSHPTRDYTQGITHKGLHTRDYTQGITHKELHTRNYTQGITHKELHTKNYTQGISPSLSS